MTRHPLCIRRTHRQVDGLPVVADSERTAEAMLSRARQFGTKPAEIVAWLKAEEARVREEMPR